MRESKQRIRSTKKTTPAPAVAITPPAGTDLIHLVYIKPIKITSRLATKKNWCFPATSSLGSKYIMVAHDADSNIILTELLKNRSEADLTRAYMAIY